MLIGKINIVASFLFVAALMLYGFALFNIAVRRVLLHLPISTGTSRWTSGLALVGMLMPLGILTSLVVGMLPIVIIISGISMILTMGWLTVAVSQTETSS
ncbi:hypothetical protein [Roseovarius sp. Pro17]|uniref:hypothetical protein n=1 Tax=Roseovarius sp. Pro17 TaxID=3108175 RepID=UPI002D776899|nr:hypothetical protein [Roseovarius sp. Pro17]